MFTMDSLVFLAIASRFSLPPSSAGEGARTMSEKTHRAICGRRLPPVCSFGWRG